MSIAKLFCKKPTTFEEHHNPNYGRNSGEIRITRSLPFSILFRLLFDSRFCVFVDEFYELGRSVAELNREASRFVVLGFSQIVAQYLCFQNQKDSYQCGFCRIDMSAPTGGKNSDWMNAPPDEMSVTSALCSSPSKINRQLRMILSRVTTRRSWAAFLGGFTKVPHDSYGIGICLHPLSKMNACPAEADLPH
jgi:hypothetical protein